MFFVYLDDLIMSKNFEEHMGHLQEVASQFRRAGLTINVKKSSFCIREVKYLGYIVGEGSLKVDPEKVKAITEFPTPKTRKQLRQFLGMVGWYRKFLSDFSTITYDLTELLSKGKKFEWTDSVQKSFELLKLKLSSAPVLAHADFSNPLFCNATQVWLALVQFWRK